jgi:predicted metal-dependent phosphoesterase TrpH
MIDLHIHSTFSDGELTPLEVLNVCYKKNISIISITDHDNFSGVRQAIQTNPYSNITVIPGIEIDAYYPKGTLHILGYNISFNNPSLNAVISQIHEDNVTRIKSLISELKKNYNISFKEKDIDDIFLCDGTVGRPDVARLCVKYGYSKSVKDAFKLLLNPLKEKVIKKKLELSDCECIKYITDAGGIASIAHPITLKKNTDDLEIYLKKLQSYGLKSVEVYHSTHSNEDTINFINISKKLNLLTSGGSDYHGPITKPDIQIGSGKNNNLNINNLTILNELLE